MIVTEQEAKTKWCPHARLMSGQGGDPSGFNRDVVGWPSWRSRCVASECMAWKWLKGFSPAELEARKQWNANPAEPQGYCGL